MAQLTNPEFRAETDNLFPTNGVGQITAADLREQLTNVADSIPFKITGQSSAPGSTDDGNNSGGNGAFTIGDVWINETSDTAYICVDNATGAAIWLNLATGGGIAGVDFQEEGVTVLTSDTVNFEGAAVTVTDVGGVATVTVVASGGNAARVNNSRNNDELIYLSVNATTGVSNPADPLLTGSFDPFDTIANAFLWITENYINAGDVFIELSDEVHTITSGLYPPANIERLHLIGNDETSTILDFNNSGAIQTQAHQILQFSDVEIRRPFSWDTGTIIAEFSTFTIRERMFIMSNTDITFKSSVSYFNGVTVNYECNGTEPAASEGVMQFRGGGLKIQATFAFTVVDITGGGAGQNGPGIPLISFNGGDGLQSTSTSTLNVQDLNAGVLEPGDISIFNGAGNFLDAGTTITNANIVLAGSATATQDDLGGGGSSVITQDEGIQVDAAATTLNFVGTGVTATDAGSNVTDVTIPGRNIFYGFLRVEINDETGSANPGSLPTGPWDTVENAMDYINDTYDFIEYLEIELQHTTGVRTYTLTRDLQVPPCASNVQIFNDSFAQSEAIMDFGGIYTIDIQPWQTLYATDTQLLNMRNLIVYGGQIDNTLLTLAEGVSGYVAIRDGVERYGFGGGEFQIAFGTTIERETTGLAYDNILRIEGGRVRFGDATIAVNDLGDGAGPDVALITTEFGGSVRIQNGATLDLEDILGGGDGEMIISNLAGYDNDGGTVNGTVTLEESSRPSRRENMPKIVAVTASRNLAITDSLDILEVDTSGGAVTVTIPTNATVAFPIGTVINITLLDAANTATLTAAGGVDLNGVTAGSGTFDGANYDTVSLYKRATDAWVVKGNIGAIA